MHLIRTSAIVILLCATALLHADQWEFDMYIANVKEGQYKDDMKAVAAIVGISEQELFDTYVAKNFKIEVVLRAHLFAKELNQELPVTLKKVSYYAEGNSKRWKKYYKDESIPTDVIERVTAKYNELAKDALKNWTAKDVAAKAEGAARRAEEERLSKLPPDPRMGILVYRSAQRTRITVGGARNLAENMIIKGGYSFEEGAEAVVFAAVTGHTEQKFRTEMTPGRKNKLLAELCAAYPPTPEQKEEITIVSDLIKADIARSGALDPDAKEVLKETKRMQDAATIISAATKASIDDIISLFKQAEGDEEVAKACVIAQITSKPVKEIMKLRRSGDAFTGWLNVITTHDLIESTERINDAVFPIMTEIDKKVNLPKSTSTR